MGIRLWRIIARAATLATEQLPEALKKGNIANQSSLAVSFVFRTD
jgi:hypothetical protein